MTDNTLQSVADELAIRNLVARTAQLTDHGTDLDEYLDQWAPDAVWDFPGTPRRGHEELLRGAQAQRAAGRTGPGTHTRHVITTVVVLPGSGDERVVESEFLFYTSTNDKPVLSSMGHYRDTVVRSDGRWRLKHRQVSPG